MYIYLIVQIKMTTNYGDVLIDCLILGEGGIIPKSHKIRILSIPYFRGLGEHSKERIFKETMSSPIPKNKECSIVLFLGIKEDTN